MKKMTTLAILQQWDKDTIDKLVAALNTKSVVSDEDGLGLSSNMVEDWDSTCDEFLQQHGYTGSTLETAAMHFDSRGTIYVVYDTAQLSDEEAILHLKRLSQQ